MKNFFKFECYLIIVILIFSVQDLKTQLSDKYPYDSLIQNDPDIIFSEMFESNVSNLVSSGNWTKTSLNPLNIISSNYVPENSHGSKSLQLKSLDDNTNLNENTLVYKLITPGISDSIFIRYYVKYDVNTIYHHSGLWVGGKNPPSDLPGNIGGILPLGNTEFHIGTEIRGSANGMATATSLFGFYNYWMGMHPNNFNTYYGNEFLNSNSEDIINLSTWNCIEFMVKLNNPVTSANGELKLWINGNLISHLGYNFPNGTWNQTRFTEGTGGKFEGFQWRNDAALNLNYIWLRNYNTNNDYKHNGNIYFDHLVVAKKYIGPISTKISNDIDNKNHYDSFFIYPNPANEYIKFSKPVKNLTIFNILGQIVIQKTDLDQLNILELKEGYYIINADEYFQNLVVGH